MDTLIRLIEAEAHRALRGARIIGLIHVERDVRDADNQFNEPLGKYIEDGYLIAWQRDNQVGVFPGAGESFGTHRAQTNNQGEVMLVHGHYDIPSREVALADMLDRAKVKINQGD